MIKHTADTDSRDVRHSSERLQDVNGMRDHRYILKVLHVVQHAVGGRTGVDENNIAILDHAGCQLANVLLSFII